MELMKTIEHKGSSFLEFITQGRQIKDYEWLENLIKEFALYFNKIISENMNFKHKVKLIKV